MLFRSWKLGSCGFNVTRTYFKPVLSLNIYIQDVPRDRFGIHFDRRHRTHAPVYPHASIDFDFAGSNFDLLHRYFASRNRFELIRVLFDAQPYIRRFQPNHHRVGQLRPQRRYQWGNLWWLLWFQVIFRLMKHIQRTC